MRVKGIGFGETFQTIVPVWSDGVRYCPSCGIGAHTMRDGSGRMQHICIHPLCRDRFDRKEIQSVALVESRQELAALVAARKVFWITDPGHGWLAVPGEEVKRVGIADAISSYSYVSRTSCPGYAMLEEDCDAALYIEKVAPVDINDWPEFCFDQARSSRNVAPNVRHMDNYKGVA